MSESAPPPVGIPAGWYPDPAGSPAFRWWDGIRWTANLQQPPEPVVVQPNPPGPPAPPVQRQPAALAPQQPAEKPYVPFQSSTSVIPARITGVANTRTGWWIAFQPLWGVVTQVILFGVANSFGALPAWLVTVAILGLNIVIVVVLIALAFADRRALLAGGNLTAASPWWILLTPLAYLVARDSEVVKYEVGAWTTLIWWIVAIILAPGLAILGYFAVFGLVAP